MKRNQLQGALPVFHLALIVRRIQPKKLFSEGQR